MSEHNRAIRMAQKFLRSQAKTFDMFENANRQMQEHPSKSAYLQAATRLEALIVDEEES